ncbi:MAG: hypothetical protein HY077_03410 [Elusimicrobia bacterium]|nr:hypothetical protein [Elusimicrobiota bacterium]
MSYQLKRINPFWHTHPMIPTGVAVGLICALIGFQTQKPIVMGFGGLVGGLAILFAARPAVSALLVTMGVLGGLATFVFFPRDINAESMNMGQKLLSTGLFALFYMILMDALVLVVCVLYNLYAGTVGFGGIKLELETAEDEEPAA